MRIRDGVRHRRRDASWLWGVVPRRLSADVRVDGGRLNRGLILRVGVGRVVGGWRRVRGRDLRGLVGGVGDDGVGGSVGGGRCG